MKSLKFFFLIILTGYLIFSSTSCKKEKCQDPSNKDCENYDPCYGQEPVTAKIEIAQFFPASSHPDFKNIAFIEDKFIPGYIQFYCPVPNAKCTWKLGAETITVPKFQRSFSDSLPKGIYTVQLIIEKEPNKACFPNDDGVDTLIKTFEIVPVCKTLTMGVFKGIWEGNKDSVIFSIRPVNVFNQKDSCKLYTYRFTNFWLKQDTVFKSISEVYHTNTQLAVRDVGDLTISKLDMKINPSTLKTTLQYNAGTNGAFKKFNGKRIAD